MNRYDPEKKIGLVIGEEMVEADTELVILKSEDDGDEETLASIDDDDEYERIGKIFMDRLSEMFDDEAE